MGFGRENDPLTPPRCTGNFRCPNRGIKAYEVINGIVSEEPDILCLDCLNKKNSSGKKLLEMVNRFFQNS
jgi:hypothetical protein